MKKFAYIASICLASLLGACDDYLTVESPDQLTSENFWRDQTDAEAGLAATYSQLYLMTYSSDMWSFPEVKWPVEAYREDIIQMGSDALNYPNWVELSNYTYTNGNSQFSTYWECYYKGISFANQVIEKTAGTPEATLDAATREMLINEGHFMRAYYHMQLLLNWKEIILRDKYITDPSELSKPLSSRTDTWNLIIEDLKKATNLPATRDADNVGRATRGAAYAYLGFAYLTRAYEEPDQKDAYLSQALEALNQVQGYSLVKDFSSMFCGDNKNSSESIFEIQFSMSSANGASYRTQFHRWIGVTELWGWDEILPSQTLINEYKKEGETATTGRYDSRMYATLFFNCDYYNDNSGRVYGYNYTDWFDNHERVAFRKFLPSTYEGLEQNYAAINVPLMRYANVLLMKAEVLNEQGHPEQAIPLINEVRDVHGDMPPMSGTSQADVRAQIEHERMLEFPLENYRWYDLRRWGKLTEALNAAGRTGFNEAENAFYPVPLTELNANDAL
ncbi:RagB/SusD domain-containing protein [gut metagenome]|uniref:RagB/SusD domain-containing protein n=1 Tax=gut metagenome TaxID=749906 RepID=J9FUK2_9ZZZZ